MPPIAQNLSEAISHNVPPEVFMKHWREIRDAKDAHSDTGMAVARAKKAAKASGLDLDAIQLLEKLAKLDTDEVLSLLNHVSRYANLIELPLGTQANMFSEPEVPAAEREKQNIAAARQAGHNAGIAGQFRDVNAHAPNSALYLAWDQGWAEGNQNWFASQDKIATELGENSTAETGTEYGATEGFSATDTPPPKRKRGRPPGSKSRPANGDLTAH